MGDTANDVEFGGGSLELGHGPNIAGEFLRAMQMLMDRQSANAIGQGAKH
jgi:hypothetical protein